MSSDWALTQSLLRQTLNSICRQSSQAFRVVVMCHDRPSLGSINTSAIEISEVPFSPPAERAAHLMRKDKERKLELGLSRLAKLGCDWVMKLDADDLIARETCAFIEKADSDAVIFRRGIVWQVSSHWHISETKNFHRICGSSFALRRHLMLEESGRQGVLFDFFISDNHERIEEMCREHNISVRCPEFPGACYVRHSESGSLQLLSSES